MWRYLTLLSFQPTRTIERWREEVAGGRNPRDVKVDLAKEIVARFHGQPAADAALAEFEARFKQGEIPKDLPEFELVSPAEGLPVPQVLKQTGLVSSTSEAIRLIGQGGVKLDGDRVSDKGLVMQKGTSVVIQVGKRRFARVTMR